MIWDTVFSTLFLAAILRVSTPILLAAIGGMLSETAGVPNITLEGSMLAGAASGALVAGLSGNVWLEDHEKLERVRREAAEEVMRQQAPLP